MTGCCWKWTLFASSAPKAPMARSGPDQGLAVRIIRHVGNYGEVDRAHVGSGSLFGVPRRLNQLWSARGVLYAPPIG